MIEFQKNWKVLAGVATSIVLLSGIMAMLPGFTNASAQTDNNHILPECIHYDKIIFKIKNNPNGEVPWKLKHTELDIKVLDNPYTVADIKGKVIEFLATKPMVDPSGEIIDLSDNALKRLKIEIVDVDYSMDCFEFFNGPIGTVDLN